MSKRTERTNSVDPWEFHEELSDLVVGRRIVAANGNTVTLDNGWKFTLEGGGDCCAWASINVLAQTLANSEHVITRVDEKEDGDSARWFIMADAHKVLEIDGEWGEGTGYYFFGFYVTVVFNED